jgi:hypothetical protein
MNNTGIFQHKYLKYKNKYQILKNEIIQKGSGQPPFECLVFNHIPIPYNDKLIGFYDIGIYDTANYNPGESESKSLTGWENLENTLTKMEKFKAAIFDNLSNWLKFIDTLIIEKICNILSKCILPNGIVCIQSHQWYKLDNGPVLLKNFNTILQKYKFNKIGTIGIKNEDDSSYKVEFYTLYSIKSDINSFLNWTDINTSDNSMLPYLSMQKTNPYFNYIKESDQFEFINNRIISLDSQNKNNKFIKDKKRNQELLSDMSQEEQLEMLQIDAEAKKADKSLDKVRDRNTICIPNLNGQYPTYTKCENAK